MSVPVYSPISDAEIAPGQDPLATVLIRLRDNPLAILGVDTTDPAPTINPACQLEIFDAEYATAMVGISNANATDDDYTGWVNICDDASPGELSMSRFLFIMNLDATAGYQQLLGYAIVRPIFIAGAFDHFVMENMYEGTWNPRLGAGPWTGLVPYNASFTIAETDVQTIVENVQANGSGKIEMETRVVSGVHQIRFHNTVTMTIPPYGRAHAVTIGVFAERHSIVLES